MLIQNGQANIQISGEYDPEQVGYHEPLGCFVYLAEEIGGIGHCDEDYYDDCRGGPE